MPKSFFMNYAWKSVGKVMAMFHLLKIRTSIDIFKNEKCKVTLALSIQYFLDLTLSQRLVLGTFPVNILTFTYII